QQRPGKEGADQGAAVAQVLLHLLEEHGEDGVPALLRGSCRVHAARPSSLPMIFTKASSRFDSPVCARSASGDSSATTRPCAITTMRSQSAPTSCMMWLEKSTQRPSSFS